MTEIVSCLASLRYFKLASETAGRRVMVSSLGRNAPQLGLSLAMLASLKAVLDLDRVAAAPMALILETGQATNAQHLA